MLTHQEQKRLSPAGASPPFFFLRPVRFRRANRNHRLALKPARTEKETQMALSNTKKNEAAETKNPRSERVRVGMITASIWENKTDKGNIPQRHLRAPLQGRGQWKSRHSYNADDLLALAQGGGPGVNANRRSPQRRAPSDPGAAAQTGPPPLTQTRWRTP